MRIVFFMESYYLGGVDTFVINLINNWPGNQDSLTLICNGNHSGIGYIVNHIKRPCRVIRHKVLTFQWFFNKMKDVRITDRVLKVTLKVLSPVMRYVFLIYNIFAVKRVLLQDNPDRLMVINGGYPGGDSCRAAGICWGLFSGKTNSIHNFHGVVSRPGWHIMVQEHIVDFFIARFTKIFVTVSNAAASSLSHRGSVLKNAPVAYIYSGIEATGNGQANIEAGIRREINIDRSCKLCLMAGNYNCNKNFNKGHGFLFQAFGEVLRQMQNVHLILCGHGADRDIDNIRNMASEAGLNNNIHIFGFRIDLPHLLQEVDVVLVSAQVFESFGFAAIEAMANAIPVVATNVGAMPEIVINNDGGYCIEKDDIHSYSERILALLKDETLRKEQGQKAYLRYKKFFTAKRMSENYARLIHE